MKALKRLLIVSIAVVPMFGCTDANFTRATNFGQSAEVSCYSGGKIVYQGQSTGKIINLQGDGITFVEKGSDDLIELRLDCVTRYK